MRLEIDGVLPAGLPSPGLDEPCGCGSEKKFQKCCWARTIARVNCETRLLVVGAGATVEECRTSGSNPQAPLPTNLQLRSTIVQRIEGTSAGCRLLPSIMSHRLRRVDSGCLRKERAE